MTLVGGPRVVFLDEPTTGLDPHARRDLWDQVRTLVADGATVLLTTQYLDEGDQLADHVAVLHEGRLVATTPPRASRPPTTPDRSTTSSSPSGCPSSSSCCSSTCSAGRSVRVSARTGDPASERTACRARSPLTGRAGEVRSRRFSTGAEGTMLGRAPSAAPSPARHEGLSMNWLTTVPIAHRGLHGPGAPENSLPAFAAAAEHGYAIELDVHLLRDGEVVVFHDDDLQRMTGRDARITDLTAADLADERLAGTDATIPLLSEVLALVDGRVPLLVEVKDHPDVGGLEARLAELLDAYRGDVAVQSFNPLIVRWFRRNRPSWLRGQLSGSFAGDRSLSGVKRFVLRTMLLNVLTAPHFVAYEVHSLRGLAPRLWRARRRPLLAWTVRDADSLARARRDADNIIFEGMAP